MKPTVQWICIAMLATLLAGCSDAPAPSAQVDPPPLTEALADSPPPAVTVDYATGFRVLDEDGFRVVTVEGAWRGSDASFTYVLIPRGATPPTGYPDAQVVEVPVSRAVVLATPQLPNFDSLGALDRLAAVGAAEYISNPAIRGMLSEMRIPDVGGGASLNIEQLIDVEPDLVMDYAIGLPDDTYQRLMEAGFVVAVVGDHVESTPLGRAEWIKFTALFLGKEERAQVVFDEVEEEYHRLQALAQGTDNRPTVLVDVDYDGTWHVPGGKSYVAALLADAGADYLWGDDETTGSIPLSVEAVVERASDADYWVNVGLVGSTDELLAENPRRATFAAAQAGNVYNYDAVVTDTGGYDYHETGAANPHKVLADLVSIFHPELLPDHKLNWYRKLD